MDELARGSASTRSSCAGATWCGPATRWSRPARARARRRVRQLRARPVPRPGRGGAGRSAAAPSAARGRIGWSATGMALGDDRRPCRRAAIIAEARVDVARRRPLRARRRHRRVRQRHRPPCTRQIVATALGTDGGRIASASPTPTVAATTPARSAAPAPWWRRLATAGRRGAARGDRGVRRAAGRRRRATVDAAGRCRRRRGQPHRPWPSSRAPQGRRPRAHRDRRHDGTPRSVAFNVHGFRVAVDPRDRRDPHPAAACRPPTPAR